MLTDIRRKRNRVQTFSLFAITIALMLTVAACAGIETPVDSDADEPSSAPTAEASSEAATTEPAAESQFAAVDATAMSGDRPLAELDPMERNGYYAEQPEVVIDPANYYYATIETDKGDIVVQLFADRTPMTVNNFVFLANEGYYDNTTFHRVLDGFMAQAGDPTGTGAGGPGYNFADEIVDGMVFDRPGLLAMANAGPGTNGSQFFITFAPTDWLNGGHTIFGEVIEGSEILGDLTRRDPGQDPEFDGDLIKSITIEEASESILPTPTPLPPTPTPYPPTNMQDDGDRPLATVPVAERTAYFNSEPAMVIDTEKNYQARITTGKGDLVIDLYDDIAPVAVNNFVVLANLGFFDGIPVNQIVPEQVVIIGSPGGSPDSDAGYQLGAELDLDVIPAKGALAYIPMQGSTLSSSSVMLLALIDPPVEANSAYSFFGQTVEGVDLLDELTGDDVIESIVIEVSE